MQVSHSFLFCVFSFLFFKKKKSTSPATTIISEKQCSRSCHLTTHVTAINLKLHSVPCQSKFSDDVSRPIIKVPLHLKKKKKTQKTHSSLTECISCDKYKYVSACTVYIFCVCAYEFLSGSCEGRNRGRQTPFPNPHLRPPPFTSALSPAVRLCRSHCKLPSCPALSPSRC